MGESKTNLEASGSYYSVNKLQVVMRGELISKYATLSTKFAFNELVFAVPGGKHAFDVGKVTLFTRKHKQQRGEFIALDIHAAPSARLYSWPYVQNFSHLCCYVKNCIQIYISPSAFPLRAAFAQQ